MSIKTLTRHQWLFVGLLLLLFAVSKWLVITWYFDQKKGQNTPLVTLSCSTTSRCSLPGGGVLRFLSEPVRGRPFVLILSGLDVESVHAYFLMRGMDMGFNRYRFVRDGDHWRAVVTLPVCVSGRRDWVMVMESPRLRYQLAFSVR